MSAARVGIELECEKSLHTSQHATCNHISKNDPQCKTVCSSNAHHNKCINAIQPQQKELNSVITSTNAAVPHRQKRAPLNDCQGRGPQVTPLDLNPANQNLHRQSVIVYIKTTKCQISGVESFFWRFVSTKRLFWPKKPTPADFPYLARRCFQNSFHIFKNKHFASTICSF